MIKAWIIFFFKKSHLPGSGRIHNTLPAMCPAPGTGGDSEGWLAKYYKQMHGAGALHRASWDTAPIPCLPAGLDFLKNGATSAPPWLHRVRKAHLPTSNSRQQAMPRATECCPIHSGLSVGDYVCIAIIYRSINELVTNHPMIRMVL